ncbi:T9SS type A sorting domain-containing protein [Algibacter luteus]|uniref:Por secretion system C-terminal sorting domain-containing protein n=1 Tax=Algibacter luteus TaxID=1178825 RepID=A0A1M6DFT0_9FLAO|nr:T9SS type A sorting domain-containing protein [Algibacter luteus]SHI72001.1 Por secretion system C-terminal sorting domain-containing protein [Algibacter luteus]
MKNRFLFVIFLLYFSTIISQTNDWYLLNKPSEITKILPDNVNANELHLTTDIGYIKYNTSSNSVTDFLNLTSQDPSIGDVRGMALDPTSNDIAFTLKKGIAVYNGTSVSKYTYDSSDLTIGESTNQFFDLEITYAKDGSLYIFKEDAFGYQKFNNGVFETEVSTTFKPQDIIENNSGTKTYFAGANNGLWELEKATTTWNNYTTSNSSLTSNFINTFAIDSNDNLFIGHFQGLDRLEPNGTITNCNAASPITVYEISLDPKSNDILVRNSKPNSATINGISIVNYNSCTWTNYKEDGTNCLDENIYSTCSFGGDGNVYSGQWTFPQNGTLTQFNTTTSTCLNMNINYLNSPEKADSSYISDIDIINPADSIFIGMTRGERLLILAQHKNDAFTGAFGSISEVTPSPGKNAFSVVSVNDKFVVENNDGWVIVDKDRNLTSHNHSIPNYLAISTKKATLTSSNGDATLVHKGFDNAFNYLLFKTPFNTTTGVFGNSEEIFTINRDKTKDVKFGASENPNTGVISMVGVKTNASGGINREVVNWLKQTTGNITSSYDESYSAYTILDPEIIQEDPVNAVSVFPLDENTIEAKKESDTDSKTFDFDNDGQPDKTLNLVKTEISDAEATDIADLFMMWLGGRASKTTELSLKRLFDKDYEVSSKTSSKSQIEKDIIDIPETTIASLDNNLPYDITIRKTIFKQYSETQAILVLLTNYGILIKKGVDISQVSLSANSKNQTKKISISPNPANNHVAFSDKSITSINIFDINGRKVLGNKANSISVKALSKGIYIIKGTTDNGLTVSKKLIKK